MSNQGEKEKKSQRMDIGLLSYIPQNLKYSILWTLAKKFKADKFSENITYQNRYK